MRSASPINSHFTSDVLHPSNQSRASRHAVQLSNPKNLFDDDTLQPAEENQVLTEVLSDVQQDFRGSSVQLVKKRAETEEEQRSHAETITSQGKSQRYSRE